MNCTSVMSCVHLSQFSDDFWKTVAVLYVCSKIFHAILFTSTVFIVLINNDLNNDSSTPDDSDSPNVDSSWATVDDSTPRISPAHVHNCSSHASSEPLLPDKLFAKLISEAARTRFQESSPDGFDSSLEQGLNRYRQELSGVLERYSASIGEDVDVLIRSFESYLRKISENEWLLFPQSLHNISLHSDFEIPVSGRATDHGGSDEFFNFLGIRDLSFAWTWRESFQHRLDSKFNINIIFQIGHTFHF